MKTYLPRRRVRAFQFQDAASLPDGWAINEDHSCWDGVLVSPDGFCVMVDRGDWIVLENDWWSRVSHRDFIETFEEERP